MADIEQKIKKLSQEYNTSLEKLNQSDSDLKKKEYDAFVRLTKLFDDLKLNRLNPTEEREYKEVLQQISSDKLKAYDYLLECFNLLQTLRANESSHMLNIINILKQQLAEARNNTTRNNNLEV